LLLNWRQQVVEGSRWITRTASSMEADMSPLRSVIIGHAFVEHQHYKMIEATYVSAGGSLEEITHHPPNVGSEALTAYLLHEASKPNPLHMFGALFIIEGVGPLVLGPWGRLLQDQLSLKDEAFEFFSYHAGQDASPFEKLRALLTIPQITEPVARDLVKLARVVSRLYCLQFEELDNH